jgi:hypothetical protein
MTNEVILVPKEETNGTPSPQPSKSPSKKEKLTKVPAEKKLPAEQQQIPVDNWIMPPEQQGYIQGNDRDCL